MKLPPASLLLGGLAGWVAVYLLALEGKGVEFLATLPVGVREVVLFKSVLSTLICVPPAAGIAALGVRLGSSQAGAASGAAYLAAVASSSALISSKPITSVSRGDERGLRSLHSVSGTETLLMLGTSALYARAWPGWPTW